MFKALAVGLTVFTLQVGECDQPPAPPPVTCEVAVINSSTHTFTRTKCNNLEANGMDQNARQWCRSSTIAVLQRGPEERRSGYFSTTPGCPHSLIVSSRDVELDRIG